MRFQGRRWMSFKGPIMGSFLLANHTRPRSEMFAETHSPVEYSRSRDSSGLLASVEQVTRWLPYLCFRHVDRSSLPTRNQSEGGGVLLCHPNKIRNPLFRGPKVRLHVSCVDNASDVRSIETSKRGQGSPLFHTMQ